MPEPNVEVHVRRIKWFFGSIQVILDYASLCTGTRFENEDKVNNTEAIRLSKVLRQDTRGTKDFSYLIGANISDPKTGR